MQRAFLGALVLTAIPLFSIASAHHHSWNSGMSLTVNELSDDGPTNCDALRVTFDDEPAVRSEEELPVAGLASLNVTAATNGGIHVIGTSDSRFSVTACKAAAYPEVLANVRASVHGDRVTAGGPDEDKWVVYFIVRAPRNAQLDLSSHNGGIGLHEVHGSVTARAENGPISIRRSSGTIDAQTTNGPISIEGDSGTIKANATNGPISVRFTSNQWNGSLDAHTENGPLSVKIASAFHSHVVIQSAGRSPFRCRAAACQGAHRTWKDDDEERSIDIGDGAANVHISTVNGPVSVKDEED